MNMIVEHCSLAVFACCTSNCSACLVSILCDFSVLGNKCRNFWFFEAFIAKLKHKFFLLKSKVSSSQIYNALAYVWYLSPNIILSALFCILSKSVLFSSVRELCQTVADCSSKLLMYKMYMSFSSYKLVPKLATFLSSCIRAFAF